MHARKRVPKVSIGLPVYNGQKYLDTAIESILNQTFTDFELIISDNASTDRTREICESYAAKDGRIRYLRNERNIGAGPNYNLVFHQALGEYFKWASHDDICAPEFLEKCVAILDRDPGVVVAFPQMVDIDDEGHTIGTRNISHIPRAERGAYPEPHRRFRRLIRTDYTVEEIFGVIRTAILRTTPLILSYTDSDRTLLVELALHGRLEEAPEVLFYHRMHPEMSTMAFKNWEARTAWFDPSKTGKAVFPLWRQMLEYLRVIRRAPIRAIERLWCLLFMGIWLRDFWIHLLKELIKGIGTAVLGLFRRQTKASPATAKEHVVRRTMASGPVK